MDTFNGIGCKSGDTGTYSYSLSTSGRVLTITPVTDTCADRTTALTGAWALSGCKNLSDPCLGDLDAGTYGSIAFAPHLAGGVWMPAYGNVRYTVPDGWANAEDFPDSLRIVPTSEFATEDQNGPTLPIWPGIQLMSRAHVPDKPADCSDQQDPAKNLSYAELVASIRALPALTVSNVAAVTIGGLPGTSLDLAVAPAWTGKCSGLALPSYGYLASSGTGTGSSGIGILGTERVRLFLLDSGNGDTLAIQLEAVDPASFDAFVASATPIVQSFQFK
jgi:hypothetical protein